MAVREKAAPRISPQSGSVVGGLEPKAILRQVKPFGNLQIAGKICKSYAANLRIVRLAGTLTCLGPPSSATRCNH